MKNIIFATILLVTITIKSQVAIGKQNVTNASVSLEFNNTENRGLILPYVTDKSGISENGTLVYDTTDYKVKYLKNGAWSNLSEDERTATTIGTANLSIQGVDKIEKITAKTVIGLNASTNTTNGILVLSDATKAMILPKVASPHLNIINPAPGMIVYDTTARHLAVFNGTAWSFWKP